MAQYAERTQVSSDKSRADIEKTLTRYGASGFMYGWSHDVAQVAFEMNGRRFEPVPGSHKINKLS
ncbi:MAG: hypothetical protein KDK51_11465 [Deltaproteobacteria bacterium]|nr:hypothetical protein [Deltaproteobacteria bacterium]